MKITGTCQITIEGDNRHPITPATLRQIEDKLTLELSDLVEEIFVNYGVRNVQLYPCKVEDLKIETHQTLQP